VYDDSEELGSSVIEIDPEGKAAIEMIAIAKELMAMKPDNAHEFN
jgi:chromosome partitioning protein